MDVPYLRREKSRAVNPVLLSLGCIKVAFCLILHATRAIETVPLRVLSLGHCRWHAYGLTRRRLSRNANYTNKRTTWICLRVRVILSRDRPVSPNSPPSRMRSAGRSIAPGSREQAIAAISHAASNACFAHNVTPRRQASSRRGGSGATAGGLTPSANPNSSRCLRSSPSSGQSAGFSRRLGAALRPPGRHRRPDTCHSANAPDRYQRSAMSKTADAASSPVCRKADSDARLPGLGSPHHRTWSLPSPRYWLIALRCQKAGRECLAVFRS